MAVLVTGGGMVGSQIAAQLLERGESFVIFDSAPPMQHLATVADVNRIKIVKGDILSMPDILHVIQDERIDRIIHTAGFLLSAVRERPYDGVKVNIVGTLNILEAARLSGVKRVVFASTGLVSFGAQDGSSGEPCQEDFLMRCLSQRPKAIYPVTKLSCEYLGLCYHDLYGVDFVTVRFSSVFGPWLGVTSGIPGRIVDQFVRPAMLGKKIVVENPLLSYSGGTDFVYVKDTAASCICACFADPAKIKNRVYNVTSGQFLSFQELMEIVKKVFPQAEIEVKHISKGASAGFPYPATKAKDISKSREEIGYVPQWDMERALRDYVEWLRKYQMQI